MGSIASEKETELGIGGTAGPTIRFERGRRTAVPKKRNNLPKLS
jgi:hypothetical protein